MIEPTAICCECLVDCDVEYIPKGAGYEITGIYITLGGERINVKPVATFRTHEDLMNRIYEHEGVTQ